MKKEQIELLQTQMDSFLEASDEDGLNPEWCYEKLAQDMAAAAALVYDSCMAGQKFAKQQKS